jgi:hypothetical protein
MRLFRDFLLPIVVLALLHAEIVLAAPWEGPRLTEDQLRDIDTSPSNRGRKDLKPLSFKTVAQNELHFSYIAAFQKQEPETRVISERGSNSEAGINPLLAAAAVDGAMNGIATPRNDALFALGVGLDVLSWMARDRTAEQLKNALKKDMDNFTHPSLWLVKIREPEIRSGERVDLGFEQYDSKLLEVFSTDQAFVLSWPFKCDQGYYRATNPFGMRGPSGSYEPGVAYSRFFLCGIDDLDIGYGQANDEGVKLLTQRTAEDIWITRYMMKRLDQTTWVQKALDLPTDKINFAAQELYKRLKPMLDDEWFAVYSAPNRDGEWKVYVARNSIVIEYPLPSTAKTK